MKTGKKPIFTALIMPCILIISSLVPLYAYRPLATEDAGVGCKGDCVLETGWETPLSDKTLQENYFIIAPVYTPCERLELSVEAPIACRAESDAASGIGDIMIAAKFLVAGRMPANGSMPKDLLFTVKGSIKTASGDESGDLGTGTREYACTLVMSRCFSRFGLHGMLGCGVPGTHDPFTDTEYHYGIALDYFIAEGLSLLTETAGTAGYSGHRISTESRVLAGATFCVSKHAVLDCGISFRVTGNEDPVILTAGCSFIL